MKFSVMLFGVLFIIPTSAVAQDRMVCNTSSSAMYCNFYNDYAHASPYSDPYYVPAYPQYPTVDANSLLFQQIYIDSVVMDTIRIKAETKMIEDDIAMAKEREAQGKARAWEEYRIWRARWDAEHKTLPLIELPPGFELDEPQKYQQIQFEGHIYIFPADATNADIGKALSSLPVPNSKPKIKLANPQFLKAPTVLRVDEVEFSKKPARP